MFYGVGGGHVERWEVGGSVGGGKWGVGDGKPLLIGVGGRRWKTPKCFMGYEVDMVGGGSLGRDW